jgi:hypothetical protein
VRDRRKLRLLIALPLLALATGGAVYMASNTVEPSNAGIATIYVDCSSATPTNCPTTAAPQSP